MEQISIKRGNANFYCCEKLSLKSWTVFFKIFIFNFGFKGTHLKKPTFCGGKNMKNPENEERGKFRR